eukprot:1778954-Pleurochrysis_carterae.AAC.1
MHVHGGVLSYADPSDSEEEMASSSLPPPARPLFPTPPCSRPHFSSSCALSPPTAAATAASPALPAPCWCWQCLCRRRSSASCLAARVLPAAVLAPSQRRTRGPHPGAPAERNAAETPCRTLSEPPTSQSPSNASAPCP